MLTGVAMGIVIFAITVGVGVVVLSKFGTSVADCTTGYAYNTNGTTTFTDNACCLTGGQDCSSTGNYTAASTATTTTEALNLELGTGGLAGWTAAIVALVVGLLFIGALMGRKEK